MEEDGKWRDESSAVHCGSQPIPLFARALSILSSFATPPHESLFLDQSEEQLIAPPKNDGSKKSRSKNWARWEMLKLVSLRGRFDGRFAGGGKKLELWEEISEVLNAEGIPRDAQQCRDKWEKLCAAYKEVRDGSKVEEDFALYDALHPLLEREACSKKELGNGGMHAEEADLHPGVGDEEEVIVVADVAAPSRGNLPARKKRRILKYVPVTDVTVVKSLLETVVTKQQKFFRDLLESMDRREQLREQIRQEYKEKWRAEDRSQRLAFNNAMMFLASKLGDGKGETFMHLQAQQQQPGLTRHHQLVSQKKRSKNWKRAEVSQLIKLRGDMEAQFASGIKRAALWEELAETLAAQGVARDGKQCREKWDKLTAGFKDVSDGVKEACDLPYFQELAAALKKSGTIPGDRTAAPNSS